MKKMNDKYYKRARKDKVIHFHYHCRLRHYLYHNTKTSSTDLCTHDRDTDSTKCPPGVIYRCAAHSGRRTYLATEKGCMMMLTTRDELPHVGETLEPMSE